MTTKLNLSTKVEACLIAGLTAFNVYAGGKIFETFKSKPIIETADSARPAPQRAVRFD